MNITKEAAGTIGSRIKAAKDALVAGYEVAKEGYDKAKEVLYVAVPVTALSTAFMASKILSPGGVKDALSDIVINDIEQSNLEQSIRELERLQYAKKTKSKAKPHDQFI